MIETFCHECDEPLPARANFCSECGIAVARPMGPFTLEPAGPEVRQGTVVSCDLADYTAITSSLYLGDSHKIVSDVLRVIADVMARFKDGIIRSVDRPEGDSVLFVFGYPRARDDDAVRATQAALGAAAAVARLRPCGDIEPQIRVGVDTGEIVIKPGTRAHSIPVHGPACNLAARLRACAPKGGVVISDATHRLVAGYVNCVDLGLQKMKGLPDQRAWQVTKFRRVSGFERLRGPGPLTKLVGRGAEIGTLRDRWQLARDGMGQVVFVSGEPGIGKSRLLVELVELVELVNCTKVRDQVLLYQCTDYRRTSAFHPIVESLLGDLDIDDDTPAADKHQRLEALLIGVLGLPTHVFRTVAGILSIDCPDSGDPAGRPPAADLAEEIDALMAVAEARLAGQRASILVLEDAHWADPSTLQVLDAFVRRVAALPTLLVVTHRPEFDDCRWTGPHVTKVALGGLAEKLSETLVRRVDENERLPAAAIQYIAGKTDGIPLFIEELTKAILELPGGDRIWRLPNTGDIPIPLTLRDSLTARLDRVSSGKAVAQVAAIIGREFSETLLAAVMLGTQIDVRRGLADLEEAGLVFRHPGGTEPLHRFKHPLIRDVARDSILRDARHRLHGLVASALEKQVAGGRTVAPEVLAHHYAEADRPELAIDYWSRAADIAARHAANAEAIYHLNQGLRAAQKCVDSPQRNETGLRLLAALARVLAAVKGYASDDVWNVFQMARALFPEVGDEHEGKFIVAWGEGHSSLVAAKYQRGLDRGLELAAQAERARSSENFAAAQLLVGVAHLYRGQPAIARQQLELAAGIATLPSGMPDPGAVTPETTAKALAYLARTVWFLGQPDEAARLSARAVELSRKAFMPLIPTQTASMCMLVHQIRGDREQTRAWIDRTRTYATEKDSQPYWLRLANIVDLWWQADADPVRAAVNMRMRIDEYRETGARVGLSGFLLLQAEVMERAERLDDAISAVGEALAFAQDTGEVYYLPEIHRRRACLMLASRGNRARAAAQAVLQEGIDIARRQQAVAWELRGANSLARLWLDDGRLQDAADLLAPVYGKLTEGFDSRDATDALGLLKALPQPSDRKGADLLH